MKKLFTLTSDNGDKLKIRVERNEDLSWKLDHIAPDFGCKPDISELPKYKVGDLVYHIRDKYVFRAKSVSEMWLFSADEDFINVIYCRPATDEDLCICAQEISRRQKKPPMNKRQFRRILENVTNIIEYKGNDRYEILDEFLEQYMD